MVNLLKATFEGIIEFIQKNLKAILMIICYTIIIGTIIFIIWKCRKIILAILAFLFIGALCGGLSQRR